LASNLSGKIDTLFWDALWREGGDYKSNPAQLESVSRFTARP